MKYFLFDKAQKYVTRINTEYLIEAHYTEEINTAGQLEITLPATMRLPKNAFYVCVTDPDDETSYLMFKIVTEKVTDEQVTYTCIENAYDELASYTYIKDKRPTAIASAMLQMVLDGTRWSVGSCPEVSPKFCSFYYISVLEAIQKIVNLWGFEVQFQVKIDGITNEIKQRNINLYTKLGKRTNKRFEYGSNLLSVTQANDSTGLYTALVGRGKGVQVSEGDTDTDPDGYGRRITFADVVWSTQSGNPLNKPAGQEYLEDPNATAAYGFPDGHPRIGFVVFQDCEDPNELIQLTYNKLQEVNHPQVQFSANIADVGSLNLGDTIAIIRHDIGIEYYTRVFKVVHDLLDSSNNTVELGDNIAGSNSITQQISTIKDNQSNVQNAIDTIVMNGADGNKLFFGTEFPTNGTDGDIFYKTLENGGTEMYIYKDGGWQLVVSTEDLDAVQKKVDEQTSQIQQAVDSANSAVSKADEAVAQVGDANTNAQKALTTAQQNQADLVQAKNDLENTKNQLTNVQSDLTGTKSSLAGAISNISQAQEDLKNTEQGLQGVKSDLANTKQSLANDEKSLSSLSQQAQQQGQTIVSIQKKQSGLTADIADVKGNVSSLKDTADGLQATVGTLSSDNLISNSDCLTDTPGVAPDTDWKAAFDWLYSDGNLPVRAGWYGYSALQLKLQIASNWAVLSAPVKSGKPNQDTDYAFNMKFYIATAATYDVFLECGYTKEFKATKDIKLGTLPVDNTGSWQSFQAVCTVPKDYSWVRLKITSSTSNPYFWIAQPMLSYGTTQKPYVSSNYPAQKMASISETVDGIKATVSDNANGISQIKQTAQSIESDVANNKNDISSIRQTADSLKSSIQDDEKNISSLQQTAQGLQGSIADNKNDIANIKATAQGLQTSVQDNKKNISTIQQQARTIESAISTVNSDNLVPNSDMMTNTPGVAPNTDWEPAWGWWYSDGTPIVRALWYGYSALQINQLTSTKYAFSQGVSAGKSDSATDYVISVKYILQNASPEYHIYLQAGFDSTFTNCKDFDLGTANNANGWNTLTATVNVPANMPWVRLKVTSNTNGYIWIAQPMIVYGTTVPTQYISSNQPGQKMSSIKQTIDSIQSTVQSNIGQISQVKQTADSLQSSITQGIGSYLPNGDFADSNISKYWVPWDTTKDLSEVFVVPSSGTKDMPAACLKIQTKSSENKTDIGTKDFIPFNINEPIEIKAWSRLNASNENTQFQFYIHCYDENHNEVDSGSAYFEYDNLNEWELTDVTFGKDQWNKNTVSMRLEIVLFGGGIDTAGNVTGLKIINGSSGVASQFTQTIDSLTSKIADADGNISQLKQTSDSLTSQIGNANNDISSLQQRADSMESNISDNKNDISDLRQTANSLQSNIQSKADISQITQLSNAIQSVVQSVGSFFPNGDFADSNIQAYWSPWDVTKDYTNITFDAATYNGSFGNLLLHVSGGGWTKAISTEYIPVQPNKSVTVSLASRGDWYGSNGKPQTLQCYVHFYDSKKNETTSGNFDLNCSNNQQWYDNSVTYDCNSNECYIRIEIVLQGNQENWAHITNVKVSSDGGESISSKISQMADDINMRVQKGDLLSQINIQAGSTLIQSNKLYLDASSVVFSGNAFIPSAAITDLSADKITTGTLNGANVHVINMDVANLVGDTTSFVRSQWQNAYGSYVNIESDGMSVGYGNWLTKFDSSGMTFKDGGDDLGGFTRIGMQGAPGWYGGLALNAGGNAEFLSIGAKDYGNVNQNPIPPKLLWMRQGINTYGYNPGWNFGDDVWMNKVGMNSIQYGTWNIKFGIITGDNGFSALTLTSGSGNGFYWGSDGSFGYVTGGNVLHNVKGSQIVYSIGSDGICHSWGGV